jgi:hypothetical protein
VRVVIRREFLLDDFSSYLCVKGDLRTVIDEELQFTLSTYVGWLGTKVILSLTGVSVPGGRSCFFAI